MEAGTCWILVFWSTKLFEIKDIWTHCSLFSASVPAISSFVPAERLKYLVETTKAINAQQQQRLLLEPDV